MHVFFSQNKLVQLKEEKLNIQVIDESFDAIDEIRQISKSGRDEDDEPFFTCNISDIIRKHEIWEQRMPRVRPFYGEFKICVYAMHINQFNTISVHCYHVFIRI